MPHSKQMRCTVMAFLLLTSPCLRAAVVKSRSKYSSCSICCSLPTSLGCHAASQLHLHARASASVLTITGDAGLRGERAHSKSGQQPSHICLACPYRAVRFRKRIRVSTLRAFSM